MDILPKLADFYPEIEKKSSLRREKARPENGEERVLTSEKSMTFKVEPDVEKLRRGDRFGGGWMRVSRFGEGVAKNEEENEENVWRE